LDLGRTEAIAQLDSDGARIGEVALSWQRLEQIAEEERKVFRLDTEPPEAVRLFSEATGWVRSLCPTSSAPTVLVSGIPMRRIKDTDPMADTRAKLKALGTPRGRVLDTATGLGYTAIEAARTAESVLTVEIDPGAIEIARLNPWSWELFHAPNIEVRMGDVFEAIRELPGGTYEAVIHDPPTVALGGELYGAEFYSQVRRVLRPGGRLFHYLGDLEGGIGGKMLPGVSRRLADAGFARIEKRPEAFGLTAFAK
jgi:predicted methyltransferase